MADTDVLQAIRIIDDKIASLLEARNRLAQAFGIESSTPCPNPTAIAGVARVVASQRTTVQSSEPSGRKVELARFLASRGPTSRATIIEESGLPEGTISYCLNDKRFFQQAADGNWAITDYSRRGLERGSHNGTFQTEPN